MMADCSPCVDNARRTDAEPGYRRFPLPDVVAFTGGGKLVRKATGYEQQKAEAALSRIGFTGCASRASGRHWSVSVDPQISPTRRIFRLGGYRVNGSAVIGDRHAGN